MLTPVVIARSGTIASGQVGWPHLASGAVRSGDLGITAGTPNGTLFLRDDFAWASPAGGSLTSGAVGSGFLASGSVQGFFGSTPDIASGTVGVWDFGSGAVIAGAIGSGAVRSGNIASGAIGHNHLSANLIQSGNIASGALMGQAGGGPFNIASGTVTTNDLGSGAIVSGLIASGQIGHNHLSANLIQSGNVASGAIIGQAGGGPFNIASGTITTNDIGSGAVVSGLISSGQVGNFAIASGAVTSGRLGTTGTPNGTLFLRDDFSWATTGGGLSSGAVGSGYLASGSVQGFFGTTRDVVSGTIGVFDFGSGAVIAGAVGSGAVRSGNVASGQLAKFHFASGTTIDSAEWLIEDTFTTAELISGASVALAVAFTQSGTLQVAMASVSGRMPAVGIVIANVLSGTTATLYREGRVFSAALSFSGWMNQPVYVGRSGQLSASGAPNSSGDIQQILGVSIQQSGMLLQIGDPLEAVVARSGDIGSGAVTGQAGGGYFVIASGTITTNDIGSGAIVSGLIASGQIGNFAIASGAVGSGLVASGTVQGFFGTTRNVASGTLGVFDFGSGAVITGAVGSGAIQSGNIASGQIGRFHIASGQLAGFELGSGAIVSGRIASGQVGNFAISSGAITSGRLGVTGTPNGSQFLRDDFTWAAAGGGLTSGAVGSGYLASGSVQGFFGTTPDIASGTVGVWDFGSGAVIAGAIGSGAVVSGNVASGQLGSYALASGAVIDRAQYATPFASGISRMTAVTEEIISGVRAVCLSQSGNLRVAMASVSGRMPAIGICADNVASGIQVNVYNGGNFQLTSGLADFSGYLGQRLYVGRSGQVVSTSGAFNSGGLLSGDLWQTIGTVLNSGAVTIETSVPLAFLVTPYFTSGMIGSGAVTGEAGGGYFVVASGTLATYDLGSGCVARGAQFVTPIQSGTSWNLITGEIISGVRAVNISQSGFLQIAKAATSGKMYAVGVVVDNVASGIQANVYTDGFFQMTSGMVDYSGYTGAAVWVGRSGQLTTISGAWSSGGFASGDLGQKLGTVINSGAVLMCLSITVWSGGPLGEATGGVL